MSWFEYLDLYEKAQKKDCPYFAIFVDVKNSRKQPDNYWKEHKKFIDTLTSALVPYLKVDDKNTLNFSFTNEIIDIDKNNPICIGDGTCYYFEKDKISMELFRHILKRTMKSCGYKIDLHLCSCKYETEDINESKDMFYKGDVFHVLENTQKKNSEVISIKDELQETNLENTL